MKTPLLALTLALFALPSCNEAPEQVPVSLPVSAEPTQVAPPEAPPIDFPVEEHAMKSLRVFEQLTDEVSYVLAVADPTAAFEILEGPEPEDTDFPAERIFELLDMHPKRLASMGIDPQKPVGLALVGHLRKPTESSIWAVFGSVADEDVFRKTFNLAKRDPSGLYPSNSGDEESRVFIGLEDDEVLIASRNTVLKRDGKSLAEDEMFVKLVNALDYGKVASAYYSVKGGKGIYGVGLDEVGLGVKVFADSELHAGTMRIKFATIPAGVDLQVPFGDRAINMTTEVHPTGRKLRDEINSVEAKPRIRRTAAAKEMLRDVDDAGSLNTLKDSLAVAGRIWRVGQEDVARAYQVWRDLDLTAEERASIADLNASLDSMKNGEDIDQEAMGEQLGREARAMAQNANGDQGMSGMAGLMGKFGGSMLGGGGKKGPGGKNKGGPAGMLGGLGGLGGMLGGKGGSADIKVLSSNSHLKSHVRGHVTSLASCWVTAEAGENFTVIANVEVAPVTGNIKITRLRNAPKGMDSCIRKAIVGKIKPPEPPPEPEDPSMPREEPKPEKATVKLAFSRE